MRQVTIEVAEAALPGFGEAACRGEDIVITREGRPLVLPVPAIPRAFLIGLFEDLVGTDPDWFAPLDGDEVDAWEGRTGRSL